MTKPIIWVMVFAGMGAAVNAAQPQPRMRSFHFPVPHDDAYQQIKNLRIDSPYLLQNHASAMSLDATRTEHIQSRLFGGPAQAHDEDPKELAQYLKPDRLVPLDDQIRAWARDVVLIPRQKGDSLNYFIYPYTEIDGRPSGRPRMK